MLRGGECVYPTHVAGYGKMNMGHVGSPHCTLAHILVFFLCYHRDLVFTGR